MPLCPPQIPHGLTRDEMPASNRLSHVTAHPTFYPIHTTLRPGREALNVEVKNARNVAPLSISFHDVVLN